MSKIWLIFTIVFSNIHILITATDLDFLYIKQKKTWIYINLFKIIAKNLYFVMYYNILINTIINYSYTKSI